MCQNWLVERALHITILNSSPRQICCRALIIKMLAVKTACSLIENRLSYMFSCEIMEYWRTAFFWASKLAFCFLYVTNEFLSHRDLESWNENLEVHGLSYLQFTNWYASCKAVSTRSRTITSNKKKKFSINKFSMRCFF